jgi:hypothetical protein
MRHGFKYVLHPSDNRMPHLHFTSRKSFIPSANGTLELQSDWFLDPSKIVIPRVTFGTLERIVG